MKPRIRINLLKRRKIKSNLYCQCENPNKVKNIVLGKEFEYCKICKKEIIG